MASACDVCGGTSLSQSELGFLVCDECGTQSQVFIQENEEWTQGLHAAGKGYRRDKQLTAGEAAVKAALRKAHQENLRVQRGEDGDVPDCSPRERVAAYVQCFQLVLQDLCAAMVRDKGCNPRLPGVVRRVWFSYLQAVDILGPDFGQGVVIATGEEDDDDDDDHMGGGGEGGDDDDDAEGDGDEDEDEEGGRGAPSGSQYLQDLLGEDGMDEGRGGEGFPRGQGDETGLRGDGEDEEGEEEEDGAMSETEFRMFLEKRLPLALAPALCFLGCMWLREAVVPQDVVAWCCRGELPLLAGFGRLPADLAAKLPKGSLRPTTLPSQRQLWFVAAAASRVASISVPPVNAPLIMRRYIRELSLPESLVGACDRLLALHPGVASFRIVPEDARRGLHFREPLPTTIIMAYLLVAIKLAYHKPLSRNGRVTATSKRIHNVMHPPESPPGATWQGWAAARLGEHEGPGGWLWEASRGGAAPGSPRAAAAFGMDHALAGRSAPRDLEGHFAAFRRVLAAEDGGGEEEEDEDEGEGRDGGRGSGAAGGAGGGAGGGGRDADEEEEEEEEEEAGGEEDGEGGGNGGRVLGVDYILYNLWEEEEEEGEEGGGEGGQVGGSSVAYGMGLGHPDYLAVLYALATHAWVPAPALHRAARSLEAEMLFMERLWERE